jgi:hypothetical protein
VGKHEGKRKTGRPRRRWEDNVPINIKEKNTRAWTGFIWLGKETLGGFWRKRYWTFKFHKMRRI